MKILSQLDPQWSKEKLGASTLTVGRYGCTTCCLSMISDYFGSYKDPVSLAHNVNNYTKDGLVLWTNFKFPTMRFLRRTYKRNDQEIQEALKDKDRAVMLQVNDGAHWVVALRRSLIGNSYIVADPWGGVKVDVIKKYRNITGAAFFARS